MIKIGKKKPFGALLQLAYPTDTTDEELAQISSELVSTLSPGTNPLITILGQTDHRVLMLEWYEAKQGEGQ